MSASGLRRGALEAGLVLGLAVLTVNRFAPAAFSGDVVLYSVMSLQNLTLFFWEQNRLLNVGPALTAVLRDPALNLYANLLFPAVVFFLLLRDWSLRALRLQAVAGAQPDGWAGGILFMLAVGCVFLLLEPVAVFEYVIWHVEYPLSWWLLALAHDLWFGRGAVRAGRWATVPVLAVAVGVNYSVVLPAWALLGARVWIERRLTRQSVLFGLAVLLVLAGWSGVARLFPGPPQEAYAGFDLLALGTGVAGVLRNLGAVLNLPALGFLLLGLFELRAWSRRAPAPPPAGQAAAVRTMQRMLLLFALGWLLLFAGNHWVALNQYHFRYFAPVLFAGLMGLMLALAGWMRGFPDRLWRLVGVLVGLGVVAYLARPFVPLTEYRFFREAEAAAVAGVRLHAGDFNHIWAGVMRGLLVDDPVFGLAERASGQGAALQAYASQALRTEGRLKIGCVQAAPADCLAQANRYLGPLDLSETVRIGDGRTRQSVLALQPAALVYRGEGLAALFHQVGTRSEAGIQTDGREGFLLYGPYRPMWPGRYRLTLTGQALGPVRGWVDVVSQQGRKTLAHFPLTTLPQDGPGILLDEPVHWADREETVEVRVFVRAADRLWVQGYALSPQE